MKKYLLPSGRGSGKSYKQTKLIKEYIEKMKNVTPKETIKNITKELKNEN